MKRRLLAALMCVCMLIGLMPATAMAWPWGGTERRADDYDAYYYILKPEYGTSDTRDQNAFIFIGQGKVDSDLGDPGSGTNKDHTFDATNSTLISAPLVGEVQSFSSGQNTVTHTTYPDFEYDGKTYTYEGNQHEPGESTYPIQWYRFSSSNGFNIGSQAFEKGYCWHVDGRVTLSDKVSVTYRVKFPGENQPSDVNSQGDKAGYTDYKNENTAFGSFTAPNMPKTKESGNITYKFDGWYSDVNCTQKLSTDTLIDGDITAYGRYVVDEVAGDSALNIQVVVDGQEVSLTPENWQQYISSVTGTDNTQNVSIDTAADGLLQVTYHYTNYDAADIRITPAGNYVIQGISGTFIGGASHRATIPQMSDKTCTVDNVDGGSTLTVYLSTPYKVQYVVPEGSGSLSDSRTYIAEKG